MDETVEIETEILKQMAWELLHEMDESHFNIFYPDVDGYPEDHFNVNELKGHEDSVEVVDQEVRFYGSKTVRLPVGRRPASGGGKFEPPTNPPEVITEEFEAMFTLVLHFDGLGSADIDVEFT